MKSFLILSLALGLTSAASRNILDEEEFLHAKEFRDEALEVEREVAMQELLARQAADLVEVVPAPMMDMVEARHLCLTPHDCIQGRHLGLGLGVQLGPVGAGASTGLGWHGIGANALAGYGHNYLQFGQPQHYSQYWAPAARTLGLGAGIGLGPVGVGASAGLGHGNLGLSAGLGWGGDYSAYGSPAHYQQYYSTPYRGPYFHPSQLA